MKLIHNICLALALGLLTMAVWGLALTVDRAAAVLFDLWKFSGHASERGIDIGANSSFQFLSLCVFAMGFCMPLALLAKSWNNKLLYRLSTAAGATYFISCLLLFLLVSSGLAFLYCGR